MIRLSTIHLLALPDAIAWLLLMCVVACGVVDRDYVKDTVSCYM